MRKLWYSFGAVVVLSFAVLGWTGLRIYQQAPPVPTRVVTTDGRQVIGTDEIHGGQNVWQSIGGMEVGSVWGHEATWRRTGPRIGSIVRRCSYSIAGAVLETGMPVCRRSARPNFRAGCNG